MKKYLLALLLATAIPTWAATITVTATPDDGYAPQEVTAVVTVTGELAIDEGIECSIKIAWDDGSVSVFDGVTDTAAVYSQSATHTYHGADIYDIVAYATQAIASGGPFVTAVTDTVQITFLVNPTEVPREIWYVVYPTLRQPWIDAPMELGSWMFQSSIIFRQPLHKGGVE